MGQVPENFHGVKGRSGRRSLREEIGLIRKMTELAEPHFRFIKEMFESTKEDKQWAVEQMMKLYPKAIPTEFASDPTNPFIIQIAKEVADKNAITPSPEPNSEGQA